MRLFAFPFLFCACRPEPLACGPGTHEQDSVCVPDEPSDPSTPAVGNQVSLDRFPPVVVQTVPTSGSLSVDPATTRIEATFSRPMSDNSWAWVQVDERFPESGPASFLDDDTAVLDEVILEPDRAYQLWLNDPYGNYTSFMDREGLSALAYPIVFATGSDPALLAGLPAAVIASNPTPGSDDVDPTLTRLEIGFSRDMDPASSGWTMETQKTFPTLGSDGFVDARTAYVEVALEPGTTYALRIDGFVDTEGTPSVEWLLTFRTRSP